MNQQHQIGEYFWLCTGHHDLEQNVKSSKRVGVMLAKLKSLVVGTGVVTGCRLEGFMVIN